MPIKRSEGRVTDEQSKAGLAGRCLCIWQGGESTDSETPAEGEREHCHRGKYEGFYMDRRDMPSAGGAGRGVIYKE